MTKNDNSKKAQKREGSKTLSKWNETLRVLLSEDEIEQYRRDALETSREIERIAERKKQLVSEMKSEELRLKSAFADQRVAAERGWIERPVECERYIDASGMVTEFRHDTGEVLRVRPGTPAERQEEIVKAAPPPAPPAPKPASKPKAEPPASKPAPAAKPPKKKPDEAAPPAADPFEAT